MPRGVVPVRGEGARGYLGVEPLPQLELIPPCFALNAPIRTGRSIYGMIVAQADLRFLRMSSEDAVLTFEKCSESSLLYPFQELGASGSTLTRLPCGL